MRSIGAFEAKTHLSALLERVEEGEEIVITRRGKAIARLVPVAAATDDPVAELKALRVGCTLGEPDWRLLRDEGRR